MPNNIHHTVETFLESFSKSINDSIRTQQPKSAKNLTKEETKALENLMKRDDIIICNADKGGAVVIIDVKDYIQEAMRQLNDSMFYEKVSNNPTKLHTELVNHAIEKLKREGKLNEKLADGLKVEDPRTPLFYLLPKVHKPNNPGRPVVSSINCHTSKISEFVDYHLQPFVQSLKSYIKDTTDFLNKLKLHTTNLPKKAILVTMDVKSLYTNIPNREGIKSVVDRIKDSDIRTLTTVISTFLWLILTLNNFEFNDNHYLQVSGVSMGTKCAPSYANLFMGYFEERYIYPKIDGKTLMYLRFIDDIFMIWTSSEEELKEFIKNINEEHPTIKFDIEYSYHEIHFLDTKIKITSDNKIRTSLYKKTTDRNTMIHQKSYHPPAMKRNIPYSQALRISRICSEEDDYHQELTNLIKKFKARGYNESEVTHICNKASLHNRDSLLSYKPKSQEQKLIFSTKYNRNLPNIGKAINENWNTLHINDKISNRFMDKPVVAFKRNDNLKRLLGQTKLSGNKVVRDSKKLEGLCSPCYTKQGNLCCKQIKHTSTFSNRLNKRIFKIRHRLNCKSEKLVYLMECTLCNNKPYVGKCETKGNLRINSHRNDSKRLDSIEVDKHFNQLGHDFTKHAKFTFIEQISKRNLTKAQLTNLLLKREDFWIIKLDSMSPNGFNDKLNYTYTNEELRAIERA